MPSASLREHSAHSSSAAAAPGTPSDEGSADKEAHGSSSPTQVQGRPPLTLALLH